MRHADLIALHRSLAMLRPGAPAGLSRDQALALVDEVLRLRALVRRVADDLDELGQAGRDPRERP